MAKSCDDLKAALKNPNEIVLPMTRLEAAAVLHALATRNDSGRTPAELKARNTWVVAQRLLALVDAAIREEVR